MNAQENGHVREEDAVLRIEGLAVGYASPAGVDVSILRDVDIELGAGETLGLVGESGCGKSTLVLAAMGYYKPGTRRLAGRALFAGRDMGALDQAELRSLRGGKMALIPQNAGQALTPTLKIRTQLTEALRLHADVASGDWHERMLALFDRVRLPTPAKLLDRYPHELSGGQQQRVAIAMALAGEPRLLLLDEPTTGLDVTTQAHVLELLGEIVAETGTSMIYVSHDMGVIGTVCDRIAVMYAGEIVEVGTKTSLLSLPGHPYTQGLLASIPHLHQSGFPKPIEGSAPNPAASNLAVGCVFADRCQMCQEVCRRQKPPAARAGPGSGATRAASSWVKCHRARDARGHAAELAPMAVADVHHEPILEVRNLAVSYARKRRWRRHARPLTVADVDLSISKGEVLGLVGESGSGKSTVLRAIAGLQRPVRGEMTLLDRYDLTAAVGARPADCLRQVQLVFQNPDASLNPRHTVAQTLARPVRHYFGLSGSDLDAEVARLLDVVSLAGHYGVRYPGQLSGGEKQRVAIARALAARPALVLCDEITSALDVSVQASILELVQALRSSGGLALLFVSHDLAVVEAIADSVVVLKEGRVCEAGAAAKIFRDPDHPYTRSLLDAVV